MLLNFGEVIVYNETNNGDKIMYLYVLSTTLGFRFLKRMVHIYHVTSSMVSKV